MRIRAIAVFESVIYNCYVVDPARPDRPILEVDALLRPGDADDGPLLLPVPTFMALDSGSPVTDMRPDMAWASRSNPGRSACAGPNPEMVRWMRSGLIRLAASKSTPNFCAVSPVKF